MNSSAPTEIELFDLHCLLALAEELNFGRAAARLHLSQPPFTRRIAGVERVVGARLFERTTRRVRLTPTGEAMVAEARAVVSRLDEALEAARAVARRQAGRLAIAYVPRALQTLLPSALVRLRERFHDLVVDLTQTPGGEQGDALRSGRADLAFGDAPLSGEGLACRRVLREELAALVPDDARFAGREAIALADLAGETLVLHPRREYPTYYDTILRACAGAGFAPRVVHREAGQNCLALVAAGEGVLLVPAEAESAPPGLRLLRLTDTGGQLRYDLYAAWRPGDASPYARYVAEALPEVAD